MANFSELQGWQKRSFEIMTAQSLNLAAELAPKGKKFSEEEWVRVAKGFFKLLLRLRNDPELQQLYTNEVQSSSVPPTEEML